MPETPSGMTYTLRTSDEVPERLRRPVANKLVTIMQYKDQLEAKDAAKSMSADVLNDTDELNDLMVVALVSKWSFEGPISLESVRDLPSGDYKALRKAVAPFVWDMFPDFDVTPEDGTPTTP